MATLAVRVYRRSLGRSQIMAAGAPDVLDDVVTFAASADHASVTSYEIIVYDYGTTTVAASVDIGKPTPDGSNNISYDCTTLFAGLATGNYSLVVNAISAGGEAESVRVHFYHA